MPERATKVSVWRDLFDVVLWRRTPRPRWLTQAPGKYAKGRYLQRLWTAPGVARVPARDLALVLGRIDTSAIWERRGVTPDQVRGYMTDALGLPDEANVSSASAPRSLRLDLALTEFSPSALWSELDWADVPPPKFFGVGHAWLQIEGVVCRSGAQAPLMMFVDRRRSADWRWGTAIFSTRLYPSTAAEGVKEMIDIAAHDIIREIAENFTRDAETQRPGISGKATAE